MSDKTDRLTQISSQLLAAMMSNPHIYPAMSDEGGDGQTEQLLITVAVEMAERLIEKVEEQA